MSATRSYLQMQDDLPDWLNDAGAGAGPGPLDADPFDLRSFGADSFDFSGFELPEVAQTAFDAAPAGISVASFAAAHPIADALGVDTGWANVGPPANKGGGGGKGGSGGTDNTLFATYTSGDADTATHDAFNIDIQFYGSWDQSFMNAFAAAADFLSSIMTDGLRDDPAAFNTFDTQTLFTVDDVLIEARLPAIDGTGSVLGRAGAYSVRDTGTVDEHTTVVGVMEFDVADAATLLTAGTWDDVILHEMIHTLGFGSLWSVFYPDLVTQTSVQIAGQDTKKPTDDVFQSSAVYNGTNANTEYNLENGTTGEKIAVETDGGSGTALAHWDEQTYWGELMTGYLYSDSNGDGVADPVYLSDWTIAALADIGYAVDTASFAGADAHNALYDRVDLETVNPVTAFYDAAGDVLFA